MKNLAVCFILALISVYVFAQEGDDWATDQPGKFTYNPKLGNDVGEFKMSPLEMATFQKKLEKIVETVHQNPVLKNPMGFSPSVHLRVWPQRRLGFKTISLAQAIIQAEVVFQFCPLFRDESNVIKKHCMEVRCCDLYLNNAHMTAVSYLNYGGDGYHEEITLVAQELNKIFIKPAVVKELAENVTVYNSDYIIFSNSARPYWMEVTAGEMFDLLLKYWGLKWSINKDVGVDAIIEEIQNEKSALTPDELKLPAYLTNSNISQITTKPNEGPFMRFNPEYFDKTLPRTDIQLIVMNTLSESYSDKKLHKDVDYLRFYEFLKQLDVESIKGLLDVK